MPLAQIHGLLPGWIAQLVGRAAVPGGDHRGRRGYGLSRRPAAMQSLKAGRGILGKVAVIVDRDLAAGE
jgi:hypothetical protein